MPWRLQFQLQRLTQDKMHLLVWVVVPRSWTQVFANTCDLQQDHPPATMILINETG